MLSFQVRLQTQQPGEAQFRGTLDCAVKTVRQEVHSLTTRDGSSSTVKSESLFLPTWSPP